MKRGPAPTRRLALVAAWEALPSPRPTYDVAGGIIGCTGVALRSAIARTRASGQPVKGQIDLEDLLDDWAWLRDVGDEHWSRAADRLNVGRQIFYDLLLEARRNGDPRGDLTKRLTLECSSA